MSLLDVIESALGEFRVRYAGRHYGRFRAIVQDIADPRQLGRIRVTVPALFGDALTAWCWPATPVGGNDAGSPQGFLSLPPVGSMVWVEFEQGNTQRPPVWSGGMWSNDALPKHVYAKPDLQADQGVKGIDGMPIPPSSMDTSEYGAVRVWQMPSGNRLEFDETEGEERVQLVGSAGAILEILSDGTVNLGAASNLNQQATSGSWKTYAANAWTHRSDGLVDLYAEGKWNQTVEKSMDLFVLGLLILEVGGLIQTVHGDMTLANEGTFDAFSMGNWNWQVGNQAILNVGTDLYLQASGAASLVAMNNVTNGGTSSDLALEMTAYNGRTLVQSTDATGALVQSYLELEGTVGELALAVVSGGLDMSSLVMDVTGTAVLDTALKTVVVSPLIQLGSAAASQPFVLGTQWASLFNALITWLDTHIHIGNLGAPTGVPIVPSTTVLSSQVTPALSTTVFGE